jgi:hypothetical protein
LPQLAVRLVASRGKTECKTATAIKLYTNTKI